MDSQRTMLTAPPGALERLHENVAAFWCAGNGDDHGRGISVLDGPPDALRFLRDFVAPSRPCILQNILRQKEGEDGPLSLTLDTLVHQHPDLELQVDVTPDGHGDCVRRVAMPLRAGSPAGAAAPNSTGNTTGNPPPNDVQRVFVKPLTEIMTMRQFRERLRGNAAAIREQQDNDTSTPYRFADRVFEAAASTSHGNEDASPPTLPPPSGVVYYSRQNDCLRRELTPLANLAPASLGFAEDAFGTGPPDAVNLWIGDERAVSSWHRDPYENLFYVLSGTKVFYLCPPADAAVLKAQPYDSGSFLLEADGVWRVRMESVGASTDVDGGSSVGRVRWIGLDPTTDQPGGSVLSYCHVMTVHVHAGEMLYLPSLWFHQVTQTCETLAINYWYDMRFDAKWCYFSFLEELEIAASSARKETSEGE